MRVGVTTSMIFGTQEGGLQRFLESLIPEMARAGDVRMVVFIPRRHASLRLANARGVEAVAISDYWNRPITNILWHLFVYPSLLRRHKIDVLWLPELRRQAPLFRGTKIVTIHDMARYHVRDKYDGWRMFYHMRVLPYLMRGAARYVTVSESTRKDVERFFGFPAASVEVILNGVDLARFSGGAEAPLPDGLREPYLLYVSRLEHPGKNHLRLFEAFAGLRAKRPELTLVIVGAAWHGSEAILRAVSRSEGSIVHLGFVSDEQLVALYRRALLFVFPSLFEGFGLPLLEAMACGTPVAASRTSSLPEVGGDAAAYFDPGDAGSLRAVLESLLADAGARAELVARGRERIRAFSWEATAKRYLDVFRTEQEAQLERQG